MCLIPSYTEQEKLNQVTKVLNLIQSPINTEAERQNFLYNLAFMNNMVVKGYMKERTAVDGIIYNVKDLALDYVVKQIPKRCFLSYDNGRYVIYVCVNSRQYSFHTNNDHGLKFHSLKEHIRSPRWDGIVGGWELSDAEYKRQVTERKSIITTENAKVIAERKEWEIEIKKGVIRQINQLKRNRQLVDEFKRVMEEKITPAQKRTKTYREYQRDNFYWRRCWELWGKKWGFGCYPPETIFYAGRYINFHDKAGREYAQEYFDRIKNIIKFD